MALLNMRRERIVHWFQRELVGEKADIGLSIETEGEVDGRWIAEDGWGDRVRSPER